MPAGEPSKESTVEVGVGAELARRLDWVERITADPPVMHPMAPNGAVWRTASRCYRFMTQYAGTGARTLETGVGISTALFAVWGCEHVAVAPWQVEIDALQSYCDERRIGLEHVRFDVRPSEEALPDLARRRECLFDLVLVDGCHGYPLPVIDWFYGAGMLRTGGVLVVDDVDLPQVAVLIDSVLEPDPRWARLCKTPKWAAYLRLGSGTLGESEEVQPYFRRSARRRSASVSSRIRASTAHILHRQTPNR